MLRYQVAFPLVVVDMTEKVMALGESNVQGTVIAVATAKRRRECFITCGLPCHLHYNR